MRLMAAQRGRFLPDRFQKEICVQNLYENRLDGPIACHVLVKQTGFLKTIGQVFPQQLYCNSSTLPPPSADALQ
jgi:hypothetical protein